MSAALLEVKSSPSSTTDQSLFCYQHRPLHCAFQTHRLLSGAGQNQRCAGIVQLLLLHRMSREASGAASTQPLIWSLECRSRNSSCMPMLFAGRMRQLQNVQLQFASRWAATELQDASDDRYVDIVSQGSK